MKAILVNPNNKSLSWSDVPSPVIKSDEVLIDIHAAGVNRADIMQRAGDYPPPPGSPEWMGLEVAGVIEAIGDEVPQSASLHIGDRVCALLGGGGYAEKAAVPYGMVMKLPEAISFTCGAAIPEAFATAYLNLVFEAKAKQGDTLLVTAGASGLAGVIIPMAKALGLYVITTVRNDTYVEAIGPLGADVIVNTEKTKLTDALAALVADGHPIDIAIDCVGGADMGTYLPYMAYAGRWIVIAALAGTLTTVDLKTIYVKNIRIIGSTLRSRKPEIKAQILQSLVKDIFPYIERGTLLPTICAELPITEAERAHEIMNGRHVGKVVMTVK